MSKEKNFKLIYKAYSNHSVFSSDFIYESEGKKLTVCEGKLPGDQPPLRPGISTFSLDYPFEIKIEYNDFTVYSLGQAKENAKCIFEKIVYLLAINHRVIIKNITLLAVYENYKQIQASNSITVHEVTDIKLNEKEKKALLTYMDDEEYFNSALKNVWLQQYKDILYSDNRVGNYLAMYSLLQNLCSVGTNEAIKNVENFIESQPDFDEGSEKVSREKTQGAIVEETIYTNLRNEIAHIKTDTDYQKVLTGMTQFYPKLLEFVVRAIESK